MMEAARTSETSTLLRTRQYMPEGSEYDVAPATYRDFICSPQKNACLACGSNVRTYRPRVLFVFVWTEHLLRRARAAGNRWQPWLDQGQHPSSPDSARLHAAAPFVKTWQSLSCSYGNQMYSSS